MRPHGATMTLSPGCVVLAPDGSEVRPLLAVTGGSMAHFRLAPNQVSRAVRHRSVEEIWFILSGAGAMWRPDGGPGQVVTLAAGTCLTIPVGVAFQFRCDGDEPLAAVAVTMPPWPDEQEAEIVTGKWKPAV